LFPDALPTMDEAPLPGGPPGADEKPFPDEAANLGGAPSRGERPVEVPPGVNVTGQAAESAPAAGRLRRSQPEAAMTAGRRPRGEGPLRPYQIAPGLLPLLPAFGLTLVTLREKVLAGRRLWQPWRHGRRHRGGQWPVPQGQ
jgi:hypothetical protein